MRGILVQNGLYKAFVGVAKKPETMSNDDWEELDLKALTAIQLYLSNEALREVAKEDTSAALWLKLETLYMTKSLTNKLHLKQQLYMLRMAEGTSIKSHLATFNTIIMDLENHEVTIEDEDKALLLLCYLPPSFKNFRETVTYDNESISLKEVKADLLSRDVLDNELTVSTSGSQADGLVVRGRPTERNVESGRFKSRSKSREKSNMSNVVCNYCKKKGHMKKDSYKLKNKLEFEAKKGQNSDKTVEVSVAQEDRVDVLFVDQFHTRDKDEWILDSACSYHMCPHNDYFSTYESEDGGVVLMGNNAACKAIGKGTIRLRMHDGVVRTLSDVRHVPDSRRIDLLGYS
ncbi:hypothetical protein Dimus_038584 [Dionaea muscipula]